MAKYTKMVQWTFNGAMFAEALTELLKTFTVGELGEMVGVSPKTIWSWSQNRHQEGYEHPYMSNFINVCNELDLDPREFFYQEDV